MDLGTMSSAITLDSSDFSDGLSAAESALNSFAGVAGAQFGGLAGFAGADAITQGLEGIVNYATTAASAVQNFSDVTAYQTGSAVDSFDAAVASFSQGANAVGGATSTAANQLAEYNTKIQDIQQNIADTMQGSNITDAIAKYNETLSDDQEAYAQKVEDINNQIAQTQENLLATEADNAQKMSDTLSDMQMSEADKRADTKEKQTQQLADTTSATERAALEKKFAEENKLEEDSYNRAYATKQTELSRNLSEENEKAQDSANQKIANYQSELSKEAELEAQKEEKLKDNLDEEVARYQEANAKKLQSLEQELAQEERLREAAMHKASGGGGSSSKGLPGSTITVPASEQIPTGKWAALNDTVSGTNQLIDQLASKSPFTQMELEQTAIKAHSINASFEALGPTITDLAAANGKQPIEAMNAVIMAAHGRVLQLRNAFGITAEQMNYVLGKSATNSKFSLNEVLDAIQKITKDKGYVGAAADLGSTYQGQLQKVNNALTDVALQIMGVNLAAKNPIEKGGFLDQLLHGAEELANWLNKNQKQVIAFGKSVGDAIIEIGKVVGDIVGFIISHWSTIGPIIAAVGITFKILIPIASALGTAFEGIFTVISLVANGASILEAVMAVLGITFTGGIALIVGAVILVTLLIISHWSQIVAATRAFGAGVVYVFQALRAVVIVIFEMLADAIMAILKAIGDLFMNLAHVVIGAAVDFVKMKIDTWITEFNLVKNALSDLWNAFSWFGSQVMNLMGTIGNAIKKALDPTHHSSPSLIENVAFGTEQIRRSYEGLSSMNLPGVTSGLGAMSGISSGLGVAGTTNMNYNTQSNLRTNTMTFNNNFSIGGEASARNMVQYMAFQSNHFGVV